MARYALLSTLANAQADRGRGQRGKLSVRRIEAQSKLRWKGDVPQFVIGGAGAAPSTPVIVPITATPRSN